MVEDERYCIDIVTQIGAVRAALRRVEKRFCAITSRIALITPSRVETRTDQRRKVAELMDVMGRAGR
jgi:DNA-binding FrmR family transcriptional regulator